MLKILAGEKKGHKIYSPKHIRPILAQIKKSVFDIIKHLINGSLFLDLYAGSGSVGIEALSRGSKFCVFVEKDRLCVKTILKNLSLLQLSQKSFVITADILKDLYWIEKARNVIKKNFNKTEFDIIFVGAPYVEKSYSKNEIKLANLCSDTIQILSNSKLLSYNGLLIVQHSLKEQINPGKFLLVRRKKYGDTIVSFFSESKQ